MIAQQIPPASFAALCARTIRDDKERDKCFLQFSHDLFTGEIFVQSIPNDCIDHML
jgi:hypothetical protein